MARNLSGAGSRVRNEEELFLEGGLFATHYRADGRDFAVVAPPLFEEQARTRKILVNMARDLAAAGTQAVRFDYPGTGLSIGPHETLTLTGAIAALDRAVAYCRAQGARRIHVLGLRFGGYLALAAATRLDLARVVAWEPVLDLGGYFQEMLRVEMSNQMVTFGKVRHNREELLARLRRGETVLVDGNRVSATLFAEMDSAPPLDVTVLSLPSLRDRIALLLWESKKLHDLAIKSGLVATLVPDVKFSWKHIRMLEPRSEALFRATLDALRTEPPPVAVAAGALVEQAAIEDAP